MDGHLPGFVGRQEELALLRGWMRDVARSGMGMAVAVRGRRAVGKSTLIEEMLLREKPRHAFFTASKGQPSAQALAGFLGELERSTLAVAGLLASGVRPDGWEAALRLTATTYEAAMRDGESAPMCLVIDELPWLAEQEPSIEGVLQSVWDRHMRRLPIMLVLIGSDLHMMEAMEAYDRPLYGRVRPFAVNPLNPAEVAEMIGASPKSALDAYCIVGGFPQLAATWRTGDTPSGYLRRELSDPTSPIVVTGERVTTAELPPESAGRTVIAAIGAGETEFGKILGRSGVGRTSLSATLKTLTQKRIVRRTAPFSGGRDTKLTRYTIADAYLRFWMRFIAPNLQLIERRRGDVAAARAIEGWSTFRGHAIEPIVREGIERMLPDERFGDACFVGAYWTRAHDVELDLVGYDRDRTPSRASFVGSIKWREKGAFSRADAFELAHARPRVPLTDDITKLVGVSRSGFSAHTTLDVKLGPDDLLGAWSAAE